MRHFVNIEDLKDYKAETIFISGNTKEGKTKRVKCIVDVYNNMTWYEVVVSNVNDTVYCMPLLEDAISIYNKL